MFELILRADDRVKDLAMKVSRLRRDIMSLTGMARGEFSGLMDLMSRFPVKPGPMQMKLTGGAHVPLGISDVGFLGFLALGVYGMLEYIFVPKPKEKYFWRHPGR